MWAFHICIKCVWIFTCMLPTPFSSTPLSNFPNVTSSFCSSNLNPTGFHYCYPHTLSVILWSQVCGQFECINNKVRGTINVLVVIEKKRQSFPSVF